MEFTSPKFTFFPIFYLPLSAQATKKTEKSKTEVDGQLAKNNNSQKNEESKTNSKNKSISKANSNSKTKNKSVKEKPSVGPDSVKQKPSKAKKGMGKNNIEKNKNKRKENHEEGQQTEKSANSKSKENTVIEKDITKVKKEKSLGEGEDSHIMNNQKPEKVNKESSTQIKIQSTKTKTSPSNNEKEADAKTRKKVAGDDKLIRRDEKGRSLYQGPRGGVYYINSNGTKTYVTPDKIK